MTGKLAISRAGHDKDRIYVIVKEEAEYVYLADGTIRTLEKLKRKKKKHIQIIKKLPKEITEMLETLKDLEYLEQKKEVPKIRDEEIKRAIKLYEKRKEYEEEKPCQKQM